MIKKFLFVVIIYVFHFSTLSAQQPSRLNASEIYESIQKLNFLGSVLYIAAHPDDENTRLISYFSNQIKARTAYLSLTRGDGGQNLIGPEIRELLGVIRTQELLSARKIDGGEQLFTRANDFGYSKHPEETLKIWDKDEVLSDVVRAIRQFKPDVIINRFDHRTPGATHGHHTSSAILSLEAFSKAADPNFYPGQLKDMTPWQPSRLFFNTSWWFYGSREKFEKADKSNLISVDTGIYYPSKGLSNSEIASLSRSQHKSQGFGTVGTRGKQLEYLEFIKGEKIEDNTNVFAGIDTSWNRIEGGEEIGVILTKVADEYDFKNPAASVPELLKAYLKIQQLQDDYWKNSKIKEIVRIIEACSGLYLEVVADSEYSSPGNRIHLEVEAINRSATNILLESITFNGMAANEKINESLDDNEKMEKNIRANIPENTAFTSPYWLKEPGSLGMYAVTSTDYIGLPETPKALKAVFNLKINETPISIEKEILYKKSDPVAGEVYKPFEIVPKISVAVKNDVIVFKDDAAKKIDVIVRSASDTISGSLSLEIPENWTVTPSKTDFSFSQKGEEKTFTFQVSPPNSQDQGILKPVITVGNQQFSNEIIKIDYPHIAYQTVVLPSEAKIVRLNIAKKGQNIGYIEGAGDLIPESLAQIGYRVTTIQPSSINAELLTSFDAIMVGIRAYNVVDKLTYKQPLLLEYVKNGGNLIIQYNTNRNLKIENNIGPYPLQLSRDRVTDENAKVTILAKDHAVLNTPNKITSVDFEGWVQERGLYFPDQWSKEYTPILAMNDRGEPETKGALLVAKYGKGYYTYTGLSFFRELPAGVPGAYRLLANILSLGN